MREKEAGKGGRKRFAHPTMKRSTASRGGFENLVSQGAESRGDHRVAMPSRKRCYASQRPRCARCPSHPAAERGMHDGPAAFLAKVRDGSFRQIDHSIVDVAPGPALVGFVGSD